MHVPPPNITLLPRRFKAHEKDRILMSEAQAGSRSMAKATENPKDIVSGQDWPVVI